jgi:hypothetical protein
MQLRAVLTGALQHIRDAVEDLRHRFRVLVLRLTLDRPSVAAMHRGQQGTTRLRSQIS